MAERRRIRIVFLAGAVIDAAAAMVMLFPSLVGTLWGIRDPNPALRLALGTGAVLMLGWTILLGWAFRSPAERRFVAALTAAVICGLVGIEVLAARAGAVTVARFTPIWALQAVLIAAFVAAYRGLRRP